MSGIAGYLDCFAVMQTAYTCISCLSFALWIYCLYAPAADQFLLPSSAGIPETDRLVSGFSMNNQKTSSGFSRNWSTGSTAVFLSFCFSNF
jgi:hypothetical protein